MCSVQVCTNRSGWARVSFHAIWEQAKQTLQTFPERDVRYELVWLSRVMSALRSILHIMVRTTAELCCSYNQLQFALSRTP
jgi:hypothetical protein